MQYALKKSAIFEGIAIVAACSSSAGSGSGCEQAPSKAHAEWIPRAGAGTASERVGIDLMTRFMAAAYLKKNAILFEDFLGCDIATFCLREVEQVSVECDHP